MLKKPLEYNITTTTIPIDEASLKSRHPPFSTTCKRKQPNNVPLISNYRNTLSNFDMKENQIKVAWTKMNGLKTNFHLILYYSKRGQNSNYHPLHILAVKEHSKTKDLSIRVDDANIHALYSNKSRQIAITKIHHALWKSHHNFISTLKRSMNYKSFWSVSKYTKLMASSLQ